jgi:predicted transcriptional regulator
MTGIIKLYRADNQPFAQIPNEAIRDSRITPNAFRLLAYLMSHQDGYPLTYEQIERETTLGKYAISKARDLLQTLGWVKTDRPKKANGKFDSITWTVLSPTSADHSTVGDSTMEQSADNKNTTTKEEQLEEVNVAQSETEQRFSEFWDSYPHRQGDHKKPAKTAFCRLTIKKQKEAIAGAKLYASHPDVPPKGSQDRRFIPMAATWLHQERWNEIEETQIPVTKEVKPRWASS